MKMPADDLYWSPIDLDSEESNNFYRSYIDPWDLENYAYIRQHLDSLELSSDASSPGEHLLESTSTFTYLPGDLRYGSVMNSDRTNTSNYAAIDEIDVRDHRDYFKNRRVSQHDLPPRNGKPRDRNPVPDESKKDSSLMYMYETKGRFRQIALPIGKSRRVRSYSYSDGYEPINPPQQIYSKLDDVRDNNTASSPIYDDIRIYSTSTTKFGLSRYGHLKIDYSYNWNSLNKYICN